MLTYGFFNSLNGDRKYDANQFSGLFDGILYDGVFKDIGECFKVSVDTDNPGRTLLIGTGRAWFNHTWSYNSEPQQIRIDSPNSRRRIDRIVLEVNKNTSVRANSFKVIKGTPDADPVPPTLSTEANVYQYPLADIYVEPSHANIYQSDIYGLVGTQLCPYAHSLRDRINDVPRNNQAAVAEMLNIARSYYIVRGTDEDATFRYGTNTCLEEGYVPYNPSDSSTYESSRQIDCSTFIGLLLRGIPFRKSPYKTIPNSYIDDEEFEPDDDEEDASSGDQRSTTPGILPANTEDYAWSMNPGEYKIPTIPLGDSEPVRTASQLAEWLETRGRAIELKPDFSNVEPGDIIFWAKTKTEQIDSQHSVTRFVRNYRYRNISHVAVCYSKLPPPENVTIGSRKNITISNFNADKAESWFISKGIQWRAVYSVFNTADSLSTWHIRRRSANKNPQTGEYEWRILHNNEWNADLTLSEDAFTFGDHSNTDLATKLGLVYSNNHGATYQNGYSIPDANTVTSFKLSQFYWGNTIYPYKHTMMEVTSTAPYVLNQTLEKVRPEEVVMICRPDLGAIVNDKFAGNIASAYGRNEIDTLYREGLYYLTIGVQIGIAGEIVSGEHKTLRVEKTQTKHGKVYSLTQTLWDAKDFGGYYVRTQYCYSHLPTSTDWTEWQKVSGEVIIEFSGTGSSTRSTVSWSDLWSLYKTGAHFRAFYKSGNKRYELSSVFTESTTTNSISSVKFTYYTASTSITVSFSQSALTATVSGV